MAGARGDPVYPLAVVESPIVKISAHHTACKRCFFISFLQSDLGVDRKLCGSPKIIPNEKPSSHAVRSYPRHAPALNIAIFTQMQKTDPYKPHKGGLRSSPDLFFTQNHADKCKIGANKKTAKKRYFLSKFCQNYLL